MRGDGATPSTTSCQTTRFSPFGLCAATRHRQYFRQSLLIDRWILDSRSGQIETEAQDENSVSESLRECVTDTDMVMASWSEDEAVYLPWAVFTRYWPSFCYPSSDDVTVWPSDEQWGLSFSHSGMFSWRARGRAGDLPSNVL